MATFDIEFLTDDERMVSLVQKYWEHGDDGRFPARVADLAAEYELRPSDVAKTVAAVAIARSTTTGCSACGIGLPFTSRAAFAERRSWRGLQREWTCPDCAAEITRRRRDEASALLAEQTAALYARFWLDDGGSLQVLELTLEEAVTLLAVVRVGADETLELVQPLGDQRLSPFAELDHEVVSALVMREVLAIDPESDPSAFCWEDLEPARYFPFQVRWQVRAGSLRVPIGEAQAALESALRSPWPDDWITQKSALWRKLALNECLEYLRISLDDHGLQKTMGEKTRHVIENALTDFSIGQVYSFIWRAAKDAAAFYVRERVSKSHAANTVVVAIERSAERALANGWDVKDYRRDRRAPESPVVQLFATAAGLGERFWTETPGGRVSLSASH